MIKSKAVIVLTKDNIHLVRVRGKTIKSILEVGWDLETLDISFSKIKEKVKSKKVRILVSDQLSYVLRFNISKDLHGKKEKDKISELIKEQIPEMLQQNEWDYKDVNFAVSRKSEKGETKDVIVIALVKNVYEALSNAIYKVGLNVTAIEPEAIAKTRDANPIIGIAKKEDIKGKDERVLNLEAVDVGKRVEGESEELDEKDVKKELEKKDELEKTNMKLKVILITLLLIVIGAGGYLGYANRHFFLSYFGDRNTSVEEDVVIPSPTETSIPTPSPTVSRQESVSKYSLLVENGSGIPGEADIVAEILASEGFDNIETANADSFDYIETEVSLKSDLDENVFNVIERALNSDYLVASDSGVLEEASEFDVVIVVGQTR